MADCILKGLRMDRRINAAGLSLVKGFESLRLTAYRDTGGVPTIGWGHTKGVRLGQVITEAQASDFLMDDLEEAESAIIRFVSVPLNDNQFAALVSFAFNCGTDAFRKSTLCKKLNAGDYAAVPGQLALWVNDNGEKLNGLVRRRKAEADLWNTPFVASQPKPVPAPPPAPIDANKTAGVPVPPRMPEPAPEPVSGGKTVAAGVLGILVFVGAFWATVEGWFAHLITLIEKAF
jgi:lysozyme